MTPNDSQNKTSPLSMPRTPQSLPILPKHSDPPQTTRKMLSHVAWLSEEIMRTSEEKINLAQAACDTVNRSISHVLQGP